MSVQSYAWEQGLLARATEAFSSPIMNDRPRTDPDKLDGAYRYCAAITKSSSRTFHLAATLLPRDKRRAVHALYAFCRTTDDLVDQAGSTANLGEVLSDWRLRLDNVNPSSHDPIPLAWSHTQASVRHPTRLCPPLIDGIACDLIQAVMHPSPSWPDIATGSLQRLG